MEHSSSMKNLRTERIKGSPYSRPAPKLKKSSSLAPLTTVRNLLSYVTSPFLSRTRSTLPTTINDIEIDGPAAEQRSESGSEDQWDGEPPAIMHGQDVFSLAAAAGREGPEFESRATAWRARGEIPGGRRETARRALEAFNPDQAIEPPAMPGHLEVIKPSPSMPALPSSSRRALLPTPAKSSLPPRAAIPSFQPTTAQRSALATPSIVAPTSSGSLPLARPSSSSSPPSSQPGSAALAAFLAAKQGEELTPEDFEVIDALTRNMKHGSQAESPPKNERYGGWAAGTFRSTPGASRPYSAREAGGFSGVFAEPSDGFSLGRGTPTRSLLPDGRPTPVYLGPGMSPRRMLTSTKKPGLKPLLTFDHQKKDEEQVQERAQEDIEAAAKKRKLLGGAAKDIPASVASPSMSSSRSMPNLSAAAESSSMGAARAVSRPFEGSPAPGPTPTAETPRPSAVALGKKRAADMMLEMIRDDQGATPEPMIFNPYDRSHLRKSSSQSGGSPDSQGTPKHKSAAPGKSILRSSTSTPLRGAAARLEASKTKSTDFFDRFKASAGQTSPQKAVRIKLPDGAAEAENEHYDSPDDYMLQLQKNLEIAKKAQRQSRRRGSFGIPPEILYDIDDVEHPVVEDKVEQVAPLPAPQLETRAQALPSPRPAVTMTEELASALVPTPQVAATPKFSTSFSLAPPPTKEDDAITTPPAGPSVSLPKVDVDALYLSAKDAALKVAEDALPFYTFTLPSVPKPSLEDSTAAAKAEAMERAAPTYEFKRSEPGAELSPVKPANQGVTQTGSPGWKKPQPAPGAWNCSLCGLTNPGSVIDKCQICEMPRPPRPTSAPSAPSASNSTPTSTSTSTPFSLPVPQAPKVDGEWTCSLCMLQNSAAMTDKCSICEAPRPKPAGSAPSSITNLPLAPVRPRTAPIFALPAHLTQKKDDGSWECSACMLRNPATAVDTCLICDTKRS